MTEAVGQAAIDNPDLNPRHDQVRGAWKLTMAGDYRLAVQRLGQEALDCACGLYLNDPTAWLQPPPN